MITEPSITELTEQIPDRYELIAVVSKRARELQAGSQKLISFEHPNKLTIAAHEIEEGLVKKVQTKIE